MRPSASVGFGMRITEPISACGSMRFASDKRHFERGIGHRFRHGFHGIELEPAVLVVEIGFVILDGAEVLARRDQHRVLDRVENDLGVDALFFAQDFNRLINAFHEFASDFSNGAGNEDGLRRYHSNFRLARSTCSTGKVTSLPPASSTVTVWSSARGDHAVEVLQRVAPAAGSFSTTLTFLPAKRCQSCHLPSLRSTPGELTSSS